MKKLVYILPLFFTINCTGQTETKESFLNEVAKGKYFINFSDNKYFLNLSDSFYYLMRTANRINFWNKGEMKDWEKYICRYIPAKVASQLFTRIQTDTLNEIWDCNLLDRGKCLIEISSFPKEFTFHNISKPIFDASNNYAMISVGSFQKNSIARGGSGIWLFVKKNGKWKKIAVIDEERL